MKIGMGSNPHCFAEVMQDAMTQYGPA